jgi:hypothetical protein
MKKLTIGGMGLAFLRRMLTLVAAGSWMAAGCWISAAADGPASNSAPARLGVYDSRAVAYAHFCSSAYQEKLNKLMDTAQAAKKAGDTNTFNEISAQLKAQQEKSHRQVFSTAPTDEAMADISAKLPQIKKEAGVAELVSKWDEDKSKNYTQEQQVDLTDRLVKEFIQPTEAQAKILESMRKQKPLPLKEVDELIRQGKI